jgi:hypothetical protein
MLCMTVLGTRPAVSSATAVSRRGDKGSLTVTREPHLSHAGSLQGCENWTTFLAHCPAWPLAVASLATDLIHDVDRR